MRVNLEKDLEKGASIIDPPSLSTLLGVHPATREPDQVPGAGYRVPGAGAG